MNTSNPTQRAAGSLVGGVLGDRYRVVGIMSSGANTLIADAVDLDNDQPVTVKLVRPDLATSDQFREDFREAARVAASLRHPNIAMVLDWGEVENEQTSTVFWVVEHLAGGSLRDLLDRGRAMTASQALVVGLEASRALAAAHQVGSVHTEVTPSKLVFGVDRRLRVVDFEMARLLGAPVWHEPARVPTHVARYASPEQALGLTPDAATDVYALSLSLLESVTGAVPFAADSTVATLSARVGKLLPVSADLGPLAAVLERAGRPDPEDRCTAAEFGRALVQAAGSLPRPEPVPVLSTGLFDSSEIRRPSDPTGGFARPAGVAAGVATAGVAAAVVGSDSDADLTAAADVDVDDVDADAGADVDVDDAGADAAADVDVDVDDADAGADAPDVDVDDAGAADVDADAGADVDVDDAGADAAAADGDDADLDVDDVDAADGDAEADDGSAAVGTAEIEPDVAEPSIGQQATAATATAATTTAEAASGPVEEPAGEQPSAPGHAGEVAAGIGVAAAVAAGHRIDTPVGDVPPPPRSPMPPPVEQHDPGEPHDTGEPHDAGEPHAAEASVATSTPEPTTPMPVTSPDGSGPGRVATATMPVVDLTINEATPSEIYDDERPRRRIGRILLILVLVLAGIAALTYAGWLLLRTKSHEVPQLIGVSESVALEEIDGNEWVVLTERERDDEFPEPDTIIRTVPVAGEILDEDEVFTMVISDGPEFRTLPEFVDLSVENAQAMLAALGLVGVEAPERVFSETVPDDSVISWVVDGSGGLVAGAKILPGETVILTVSMGPAPRAVPVLAGMNVEQATAAVGDLQLELAQGDEVFSDDLEAGLVVTQTPAPTVLVGRGSTITIQISKGPDVVTFPSIVDRPYAEAEKLLVDTGFTIGSVLGTTEGTVISASIDGVSVDQGDIHPRGTPVDIISL